MSQPITLIRCRISIPKILGDGKYEGSYDVTPTTEAQTLETANKLLTANIKVKSIPYFEVSNQNGTTVYIGGEV